MESPNHGLADALAELGALLRAAKADRFRVRAYQRAARVVRAAPMDLRGLDPAEMKRLAGIGDAIARLIDEYHRTGTIGLLEEMRAAEAPGVGALLGLPLIGLRDARILAGHGFTDVGRLRDAAARGSPLRVLDDRLAARVRESLRRWETTDARTPRPFARRDAERIEATLGDVGGIERVVIAGDVRRGLETVERFDFVVVGSPDVARRVEDSGAVVRVLDRSDHHVTVMLANGRPARMWCVAADAAGAALLWATGSEEHVGQVVAWAGRGSFALRPDGLWRNGGRLPAATDDDVYAHLGLVVVPPPLREGAGEVEAAAEDRLPSLVEFGDLRGDLHVHSDWSRDGTASLAEMVTAAAARGYAYVAITDHAENLRINGMSREAVLARRAEIRALQQRHPDLHILDAAELNVGGDGSLDYDLEFLLEFDLGVASIHSHMDRPSAVQTERILAAIEHPAVHMIGHPTGRILGHRPAYSIEIRAIAQAAAETGTALEINGSPRRLDLSGEMARAAVEAGALLSLSSDAHSVSELDYIANAIPNAQRAWATPVDVLNCRTLEPLLTTIDRKRRRAV
jgi:DNA polymerase (family 10)